MEMLEAAESSKNLHRKARRCSDMMKQSSKVFAALGSIVTKRKSWSCNTSGSTCICEPTRKKKKKTKNKAGCFPVYVGPEKQRFVVKTEFVNHPLFRALLEQAALVYGYRNDGPLLLPCDVDLFLNGLAEMEGDKGVEDLMMRPNKLSSIQIFLGPARARHSDLRTNNAYRILKP